MKLLLIRERKEQMKEIYRMTKEEILQNQHISEKGLTESRGHDCSRWTYFG